MAAQVATAIERASESLRNGDLIVAEQVIDADERINDLQRDIDDMCVMLLARQQPVADNLRTVISALRMAQTLLLTHSFHCQKIVLQKPPLELITT